jgi:mRNA interferase MazF
VKRYEVRWADLDPTQGSEMAKTRPVVIVSLDVLNARLQTVTVCPLTTQLHPTWRTRLAVRVAKRQAEIAVDQIRTISKARLGKKLGSHHAHRRGGAPAVDHGDVWRVSGGLPRGHYRHIEDVVKRGTCGKSGAPCRIADSK